MEALFDLEKKLPGRIHTVLIEDEEQVRQFWIEHYRERGWTLDVFETPFDFRRNAEQFRNRPETLHFYLDQDFGPFRGMGVQLAHFIRGLSHDQTVSLITAYSPASFRKEMEQNILQNVFSKYPEPVFGPDYLNRRMGLEIEEKGLELVLEQTINRIERAIASAEAEFKEPKSKNLGGSVTNLIPAKEPWWKRLWMRVFSLGESPLPLEFRAINPSYDREISDNRHYLTSQGLSRHVSRRTEVGR